MTPGEFIARAYDVWGERIVRGIARLAVRWHLIEFRGRQRLVIS